MREQIKNLPHKPGVYHYYDCDGRLLYIGKAKDLAARVKSYFRFSNQLSANPTLSARIKKMIDETVSLHYIVVESEHDALILENSLIKQLKPKYNILLRDDKTYPYIYINYSSQYPRFEITRKIIEGKSIHYFGPYSIGARDILDSIYELCKLVQKPSCLKGKKACLFYQIEKCLAPCEKEVSPELYAQIVNEARELIENKKHLLNALKEKMNFYADMLRFEEAKEIRDRIERIEKSQESSQIDLANQNHYDIFSICYNTKQAAIVKLFMRYGKIISSAYDLINIKESFDINEAYERVLLEYYKNEKPPIVAPILLGEHFENIELIQTHLSKIFEKKASLSVPIRGDKKRLIHLATINAEELLNKPKKDDFHTLAQSISKLYELEELPMRVEIFDNSHISGQAPVGAMVTCKNNIFEKSSYRLYHLISKDEYSQMRETLSRRIDSFEKNPPPNLWIIDGGATLLKLARELLHSQGVRLDVIGISKEKIDAKSHRAKGKANDIIHTASDTFRLAHSDKRLLWVQRLRDEAHRAAITFHKKSKLKNDQESQLLSLKGISTAKIKKLLNHFGTFDALKKIPEDEISSLLSLRDAKIIKKYYK
ncbi:MAG: excinuclease ABC subunit UvrC [Campylobacterota bacterium]|nr:excinuclease ABC subunit UvrC [Campylobacterota bacterium]